MLDERKTYTLVAEPTGEVYRRLLVCSLASCDMGLLVIRSGGDLHAQAARVLQQLEPFLVSCREESSWPGTTLVGHTATVRRFRWCPETQDVLARTVEGLYRWREPRLPEDPCLFPAGWQRLARHHRTRARRLVRAVGGRESSPGARRSRSRAGGRCPRPRGPGPGAEAPRTDAAYPGGCSESRARPGLRADAGPRRVRATPVRSQADRGRLNRRAMRTRIGA